MRNVWDRFARGPLAAAGAVLLLVTGLTATAPAASATPGDPIGAFDILRIEAFGYAVEGWAADPDAPGAPVELHVYVNGFRQTYGSIAEPRLVTTGVSRPDVAAVHPWAGDHAGFHHRLYLQPGSTVCLYAINQGAGTENTTLGCRTADPTPTASDPTGSLDEVTQIAPGLVRVRGWAGDPDAAGAITVHVGLVEAPSFYNPTGVSPLAQTHTDGVRPDVRRVFPTLGERTGFDAPFALGAPRAYRVCAWAINEGPGANNTTLGCLDVTVTPAPPSPIVGKFDTTLYDVTDVGAHYIPGSTRVAGWAFDPRHPGEPVTIRIRYLRPPSAQPQFPELTEVEGTTGVRRDDVAAAVPGAGPNQGYVIPVGDMATAGGRIPRSFFAVYAVDRDGGPDVLLGYRV